MAGGEVRVVAAFADHDEIGIALVVFDRVAEATVFLICQNIGDACRAQLRRGFLEDRFAVFTGDFGSGGFEFHNFIEQGTLRAQADAAAGVSFDWILVVRVQHVQHMDGCA